MNELSLAGKWELKPEVNIYNTDILYSIYVYSFHTYFILYPFHP